MAEIFSVRNGYRKKKEADDDIREIKTYIQCCQNIQERYPDDKELINQAKITAYERISEVIKRGE